jgi:hypothetical protein
MSTPTSPADVVTAAMSIAKDAADGKLSPAALEATAVAELRELVGEVVGPGDPVWPLQVEIARQVLALDGIPADELSEWLAVARQRAGTPQGEPDLAQFQPGPESLASVAQSAESVADLEPVAEQAEPELELATEPGVPTPIPPARPGQYDPLASSPPSRTLHRPL